MQDGQQCTLIYNERDPPHPDPSSRRATRTSRTFPRRAPRTLPRDQNLSSPRNQNLPSPRNQNLSLPRNQNQQKLSSLCSPEPETQDLLVPCNQTQNPEAYSLRRAIQNPKHSLRRAIQNVPDSSRSGLVVPAACRYNVGGQCWTSSPPRCPLYFRVVGFLFGSDIDACQHQ